MHFHKFIQKAKIKNPRGVEIKNKSIQTIKILTLPLLILWFQWGPSLIPGRSILGDYGDSRFNMLMLENSFKRILDLKNPFETYFYFPLENIGGLSDLHLATVPFYGFFRLLGFGMFVSMQAWVITGLILNYLSARYVLKKLVLREMSAQMGAAIFTFSGPIISQTNHLQLLWRWQIPFAFLFLFYLRTRFTLRNLIHFTSFLAIGFLSNVYIGFFTASICVFYIIISKFYKSTPLFTSRLEINSKTRTLPTIVSLVVIVIAIVVYVQYYLIQKQFNAINSISEIRFFSPTYKNWLNSNNSIFWRPINALLPVEGGWWENQLYPGSLSLICLIYFAVSKKPVREQFYDVIFKTIILSVFFVTASAGFSPFILVSSLPGFNAIRAPGRIILVLLFLISIICAYTLDQILLDHKKLLKATVVSLFIIDVGFNIIPTSLASEWFDRPKDLVATYSKMLAENENSPILVLPSESDDWNFRNQLDGMLVAELANRKTLNGYSSKEIRKFPKYENCSEYSNWIQKISNQSHFKILKGNMNRFETVLIFNEKRFCKIKLNY